MVCRQHASAAKVKFTNLTTYSYKYLTNYYYYMITRLMIKVKSSQVIKVWRLWQRLTSRTWAQKMESTTVSRIKIGNKVTE